MQPVFILMKPASIRKKRPDPPPMSFPDFVISNIIYPEAVEKEIGSDHPESYRGVEFLKKYFQKGG